MEGWVLVRSVEMRSGSSGEVRYRLVGSGVMSHGGMGFGLAWQLRWRPVW